MAYNFRGLIRSAARRIWMWSPNRRAAIVHARVTGKTPYHVKCADCGTIMKESLKPVPFRVDHIVPASEPSALIHDWNDFFERLNVDSEGLQILCIGCHDIKTHLENAQRRSKHTKLKRRKKRTIR